MEPLLRVEHLTIQYEGKEAVKDVSFTLQEGEILGIAGESGSGKSTLLWSLLGISRGGAAISEGEVWYRDQNITQLSERELRRLRGPEIGMIVQDCRSSLCPTRTIGAQITEMVREHEDSAVNPLRSMCRVFGSGNGKSSKKEIRKRAEALFKKIGFTDCDRVWNSYPFELSGGMNQRIGICMAMMLHPNLLLADEPTSALDAAVQKQTMEELLMLRKESGTAMILVTHNLALVKRMADRVLILKDGEVQEYGPCSQVLEQPESPYTKELLDARLHLRTE